MKRVDLLREYQSLRRAESGPLWLAGGIVLAGVLALLAYLLFAESRIRTAQELVRNAAQMREDISRLRDQVKTRETDLAEQRTALQQRRGRLESDRRILAGQVAAAAVVQTRTAATLVRVAGLLPPAARLVKIEVLPARIRLEGYGISATQIMEVIAGLRSDRLAPELERLSTQRRHGEDLLFFQLTCAHADPQAGDGPDTP